MLMFRLTKNTRSLTAQWHHDAGPTTQHIWINDTKISESWT